MSETQDQHRLLEIAREAMTKAYAPYSGFRVGAALLARDGRVFTGCNIENASYGLTNCAERTAIFKAVSEGVRELAAIAVVVDRDTWALPCGACRQVMAEFAPDLTLYLAGPGGQSRTVKLAELLPMSFGRADLQGSGSDGC